VWPQQWRGRPLHSLSSPQSSSVLRSVTQEGFKGGGALAGSVLRAMWVMVSKRWCSFSSGEDGLMAYRLTLAALIQNAL
jgi:hypothetical protein